MIAVHRPRAYSLRRIGRNVMRERSYAARQDVGELDDGLNAAAALIERDPDAAALLLDGISWRVAQAWYAGRGLRSPLAAHLLGDLERQAPSIAWRLRLALRAPDVRARLVHCRGLVSAVHAHAASRYRDGIPMPARRGASHTSAADRAVVASASRVLVKGQ